MIRPQQQQQQQQQHSMYMQQQQQHPGGAGGPQRMPYGGGGGGNAGPISGPVGMSGGQRPPNVQVNPDGMPIGSQQEWRQMMMSQQQTINFNNNSNSSGNGPPGGMAGIGMRPGFNQNHQGEFTYQTAQFTCCSMLIVLCRKCRYYRREPCKQRSWRFRWRRNSQRTEWRGNWWQWCCWRNRWWRCGNANERRFDAAANAVASATTTTATTNAT